MDRDKPQFESATPFENIVSNLKNAVENIKSHQHVNLTRAIEVSTASFGTIFSAETIDRRTTHDMALQAVKGGNVKLVPELDTFLVKDQQPCAPFDSTLDLRYAVVLIENRVNVTLFLPASYEKSINQALTERPNKR